MNATAHIDVLDVHLSHHSKNAFEQAGASVVRNLGTNITVFYPLSSTMNSKSGSRQFGFPAFNLARSGASAMSEDY